MNHTFVFSPYTHKHSLTHTHKDSLTHTNTHSHTQTLTHTHTHSLTHNTKTAELKGIYMMVHIY